MNNNNNENKLNIFHNNIKITDNSSKKGLYFVINNNIIRENYILLYQNNKKTRSFYKYNISNIYEIIECNHYQLLKAKFNYIPLNYDEVDKEYESHLLPNTNEELDPLIYEKLKNIKYHKSPKNEIILINYIFNDYNRFHTIINNILKQGSFEFIKFLFHYKLKKEKENNNNNKINNRIFFENFFSKSSLLYSCIGGNINITKWLYKKSFDLGLSLPHHLFYEDANYFIGTLLDCAYGSGNFDMIEYIKDELGYTRLTGQAFNHSTNKNNINLIEHLYQENSLLVTEKTVNHAITKGGVEIVKYLINKGHKCSSFTIDYAALGGHLEMVEYLVLRHHFHVTNMTRPLLSIDQHEDIINFLNKHQGNNIDNFL